MWIALEHVESDSQLYGEWYVIAISWMISGLPGDSNKKCQQLIHVDHILPKIVNNHHV